MNMNMNMNMNMSTNMNMNMIAVVPLGTVGLSQTSPPCVLTSRLSANGAALMRFFTRLCVTSIL